jgi:hypothetical protein
MRKSLRRHDSATGKWVVVTQAWVNAQKPLMRYDADEDMLVPVTQAWLDDVQRRLMQLSILRSNIHKMTEPGVLLEHGEMPS